MKYYKAPKRVVGGVSIYGKLPPFFVIGYESETEAYFELLDDVHLPEDSGVEFISESEYTAFVETLAKQTEEQRQQEEAILFEQLEQGKNDKEQLWQLVTDLQLEQMTLSQQLTDAQLEIEVLKGGN